MLPVTIRQIEYATATARFGGVTAAAEALHISQPALSVALAQLESTLGQPLFLRRPGGRITQTAFGRTWLAEAQTQLDALTRLMSGETPAAPIRLACFEDLAPTLLGPLLRRIATTDPGLVIEPAQPFPGSPQAARRALTMRQSGASRMKRTAENSTSESGLVTMPFSSIGRLS